MRLNSFNKDKKHIVIVLIITIIPSWHNYVTITMITVFLVYRSFIIMLELLCLCVCVTVCVCVCVKERESVCMCMHCYVDALAL